MKNIVLVGMMGAGKTTVGELLATKLNRELKDIDCVIEQEQKNNGHHLGIQNRPQRLQVNPQGGPHQRQGEALGNVGDNIHSGQTLPAHRLYNRIGAPLYNNRAGQKYIRYHHDQPDNHCDPIGQPGGAPGKSRCLAYQGNYTRANNLTYS